MLRKTHAMLEKKYGANKVESEDEDYFAQSIGDIQQDQINNDDDLGDTFANTSVIPVMMVDVSTTEEQLASLTKLLEGLAMQLATQDCIITQLLNGESS